ncbi:MAG: histidine kinase [Oscillospiraceae bacterium]|nr:histidine kinase [Oscillospiraceae bacterium]
MDSRKMKFPYPNKSTMLIVGILAVLFLAMILLWHGNATSNQALPALIAQVYFEGEYRIGEGEWHRIVEGEHIPSTKGDVTLRGNFHMLTPDGEYVGIYRYDMPVAFYTNHINLTFYEGENEPYVIDMENPLYGKSACGVSWTAHTFTDRGEKPIEILIHNPHSFGNETAIDEMLSNITLWSGIDFEKEILNSGELQRDMGIVLMLVAAVFLGSALFSSLIHIPNSKIIWLLGAFVLFAGFYFSYSADGVNFWSESIISNTTILGISMMFYMLFFSIIIVYLLKTTQKIGNITVSLLGTANAVFFVLPIFTDIFFYDTWLWWIAAQLIANTVLAACLLKEFITVKKKERFIYIVCNIPLLAFVGDVIGTWIGIWKGGVISKCVFIILFAASIIMVLKYIPQNINAASKAKELEVEKIVLNSKLAESRISTMMSQIRPHFIYNTLGSIEHLCKSDPLKAKELVHNFAKYLRGNFGELDNPNPILMTQEMEHVRYYISIENVRFPDMTFTFEMNSEDFIIPALTVQPIVENAIKHGLMKLTKGGVVHVRSYETDTHYCISVTDNGAGFDTSVLTDDREHVGIRNIRERLKAMVNGKLDIESTPGVGTKVVISIPKEVD